MKGVIIDMDLYAEIRRRHLRGESTRSISRTLGISRQTVKKYSQGEHHPDVRKPYERKPSVQTDMVKKFILACFKEDEDEGLKKQTHTAKRIYDRLVEEKDFTGSYSTVRTAVRNLRALQTSPTKSMVPLSYEPGEAIQIDWGEATVYENGQKKKIFLFCGRLCYSHDIFVQLFRSANEESFLEAQQRMFDYFVGIPKRLIFDNAKVAVKDGFGLHAKLQNRYLAFCSHYAFTVDFCNPAQGHEKGLVEGLVGYGRRNFLVPVPRFSSLEDFNKQLIERCLHYRCTHKVESRDQPVAALYELERSCLHPIPAYRYDTSKTTVRKPDEFSTVRYDRNFYSVPTKYIGRDLTVKGYGNTVKILFDGSEIASYIRSYGKGATQYHLEHYLDLLEIKPRAVFNARPVKETMTQELLKWGRLLPGGNREMVKLLRLCVDHGEDKILAIKSTIPPQITPTVDMIRSYLHEPSEPADLYLNREIPILQTDLTQYDRKCGVSYYE